ncbi:hypothetical protein KY332_01340 [Candidatus Woesearchaeota archaeon]|nr:hypothetical protein [Candidatus Woesearchaeota archaeon]
MVKHLTQDDKMWHKYRESRKLIDVGEFEKAAKVIDKYEETGSELAPYLYDVRGWAYLFQENYSAAVANFKRAVRLSPKIDIYLIHLYLACKGLSPQQPYRVEEAINAAEKAVELGYIKRSHQPEEAEGFLEDVIQFCNDNDRREDASYFFDMLSEIDL